VEGVEMKSVLAISITILVTTGLVACGGDGGPSKSAYIEKADALCAATDKKLDAALRFKETKPPPQKAAAALRTVLPEERKLLSELRKLEKPKADENEIDRIYDAWERAISAMEAASRDPAASVEFVTSREDQGPFAEPRRLAQGYHMVNCGESTPTVSGQP
jgi:hypothetical protein